jgi:hypothetical protein
MEERKILVQLDKSATGKRKRYIIGNTESEISGAIYIKPEVELPITITIFIQKGGRNHEVSRGKRPASLEARI